MLSARSAAVLTPLLGDERIKGISAFLARNGFSDLDSAELLTGGKNNKVIRLVPSTGPARVLKLFFHSAADRRDRLAHEFAFARFAWAQGLRALPEPIDAEPGEHCALFEFVAGGKPLYPPSPAMMAEAVAFIAKLNRDRSGPQAASLPCGSEACFSLHEHVALVDGRIERLLAADLPEEARHWIEGELLPLWGAVKRAAALSGKDAARRLEKGEQIISPSDFGFHNVIARAGSGALCFHDFEYAGWDDPAKLFGDMFNQIELPLPVDYLSMVAISFRPLSSRPEDLRLRLRWLLPVYGVKWCCIALNPLIAAARARRDFAGLDAGQAAHGLERARRQLARARHYHQREDWLIDV